MVRKLFFLSVLFMITAVLFSCGKADVGHSSGRIAAIVNGNEIAVHRINHGIASSNHGAPVPTRQAAAQALERIIDEELLVQKALAAKLDRDPQVVQAVEDAKRRILAHAYVERTTAAASAEIRKGTGDFYKENPALFERRRIYRVHEIVVVAPQEIVGALEAAADRAKNLDEIAVWLNSRHLPFSVEISSRPAEQIPINVLSRMFVMHEGQMMVVPTSRGASVVQLLTSEAAPLSEQQAVPIIERYLLGRKRLEFAEAEVRRLRGKAKILYVGEFDASRRAAPERPAALGGTADGGVSHGTQIRTGAAGMR